MISNWHTSGNSHLNNISIEDIIDDFCTFLAAGAETTAITISCLIWLLLKHPEISQRVVCEVKAFKQCLIQNHCDIIFQVDVVSYYCIFQSIGACGHCSSQATPPVQWRHDAVRQRGALPS